MGCPTDYEGYRDCDRCDRKDTCESAKIKCDLCGCIVTRCFMKSHQQHDSKCIFTVFRTKISQTLNEYEISGSINAEQAIGNIADAYSSSFSGELS